MKINVVYATRTGHSKMLAEAIGGALRAEVKNVKDLSAPQAADVQFVVGGIYRGRENPVLLKYAKKLNQDSAGKVVLVTSSLFEIQRQQKVFRRIIEEKGIEVAGEIGTSGGFLFFKCTHPNEEDLKSVAEVAQKIVDELDTV